MFTGLIETTGTVVSLKTLPSGVSRLTISAPALAGRWKIGDSIAVNGVCLTALLAEHDMGDESHPLRFAADLAQETVERTTLTSLAPGALVNLERPTPSGSPLGGHVVQGHVDGTAVIRSLIPLHPDLDHTDWRLRIALPTELAAHVVPQGSITIDGISLTVASVHGDEIEIAIIPHTYHATNLHTLLSGAPVNIETDVLSKYAFRHAEASRLTVESLIARGY
jgi:riboflavin synthase